MRIHELVSLEDVVIAHADGYLRLLASCGAVYDTPETSDPRNLSVACGILLDDVWSIATAEQVAEFLGGGDDRMMRLDWVAPPPRQRPVLSLVVNA